MAEVKEWIDSYYKIRLRVISWGGQAHGFLRGHGSKASVEIAAKLDEALHDLIELGEPTVASHAPATAERTLGICDEVFSPHPSTPHCKNWKYSWGTGLSDSPAPSAPATGKRMMVSYPGLPSDEPHEESPDCRGQGCIPLERLKPECKNPNHALTDGSPSPHEIGPSCMAEAPTATQSGASAILLTNESPLLTLQREVETLKAELDKCGKEKCMGHRIDGVQTWVTLQALQKEQRRVVELERTVSELRAREGE